MADSPVPEIYSVKVPVTDPGTSRRWYADLLGLHEEMEWPDQDHVVRGRLVGFRDPDAHELSCYAETTTTGVREDSVHAVRRATGDLPAAGAPDP